MRIPCRQKAPAALGILTRSGWLDFDALSLLAHPDLLELAVLKSLARLTWLDLAANKNPNS